MKPGIPSSGPIFEVTFPVERTFGAKYSEKAIYDFIKRVKENDGVYCELDRPKREPQMSDQQYMCRLNEVWQTRAVAKIISAKSDGMTLTLLVQAVGNNREFLESGQVTLGHRGFMLGHRADIVDILVTFDVIGNELSTDPRPLVKI